MEATVVGGDAIPCFPKLDDDDVAALSRMMRWAGTRRLNEILRPPFEGRVAGPSSWIWAVDPTGQHERILIWQIHGPMPGTDDRIARLTRLNVTQGGQPGCEWAARSIRVALCLLHELWWVEVSDEKVDQVVALAGREAKRKAAIEHYKAMLVR
jgi:hypothetical protein